KRPVRPLPPSKLLTSPASPRRSVCAPAALSLFILTQAVNVFPLKECSMFFNHLQSWMNRKSATGRRQRRTGNAKATPKRSKPCRLVLEALEERAMLTANLSLVGTQTLTPNINVNASQNRNTNESEMEVDINPTNALNVVGFVHNTSNLNQIQV